MAYEDRPRTDDYIDQAAGEDRNTQSGSPACNSPRAPRHSETHRLRREE